MKISSIQSATTTLAMTFALVSPVMPIGESMNHAAAGTAEVDYETLPPDPSEGAQKLAAAKVTMPQAIEMAMKASGGTVLSAVAMTNTDKANNKMMDIVTYEVICAVGGVPQRIMVDGMTGAITSIKLSPLDAIVKASAKVNGVVQSVSGDFGANPPAYFVSLFAAGKIHTVAVNATDGSIISDTARGQLPGVDTDGQVVTLPDGLKYIDIVKGTGPMPSGPGAVVEVHYTGYLVDGTKFDSSVDRGTPASFPLANVIKGWTEGVGSMNVGGKRKLIIPYALAYGPAGRQGAIPPKATLIFDVELLKIVSDPATAPAAVPAPAAK